MGCILADVPPPSLPQATYRLGVTRYQRVSSMLVALVILLAVFVFVLFAVWLTGRILLSQTAVPVEFTELGEGTGPMGGGMELEALSEEEIGEETDLLEPQLQDRLAAVADAVGTRSAMLDDPTLSDAQRSGRGGGGSGDGRLPGSGSGEGQGRHWEVRFLDRNTLQTYARQLDFFGIELGVLMPGNQVAYASGLSKPKPAARVGPADQEQRYYLTWRQGELQQADRELLARAGIDAQKRIILKFLPPKLEAELVALERQRAGNEADQVKKTYFAIRSAGEGYRFEVTDQSYR